ncbi:hypothetical protein QAD02_014364 [Eretmocerus hayati]|uniref:Uncharacterized protein n=1 Tax=Eretmocerus hayati TaxID=131215 RepID=A0ACC2P597_9HYME|nr:hypothetical protein QAD02_014364 [Eretmocerus hayati]
MARGPTQGCRVCTGSGGCNWCLHLGEAVPSLKNPKKKTIYYSLQETVPPRRADANTVKHMGQALVTGKTVFGLKYVSPLVNLKYFKIVNGWVPDILHCESLGGELNGYPFESGNGEMLKTVHSGKGVINQICRNVNMGTSLQIIGNGIQRHDSPAVQFCRSLKKTERVKSIEVGRCRCFGKASVTPDWVLRGIDVAGDQCGVYHRMCKQGCLYRFTKKVSERSDNSHVQLEVGSFIEISFFVADRLNDKLYIAAKDINVHRVHDFTFLNKITDINGDLLLVDSAEIKKICFYLELTDSQYIIPIPTMTTYS